MRDDELQVLGTRRKMSKRERWRIAITATFLLSLIVALGIGIHYAVGPQQPERIMTGKKMGDPTIVPELQQAIDSLLRDELEQINGLQGQAIVMEVETGEILAMVGQERN